MLENYFYFLFDPSSNNWQVWDESGYVAGFLILFGLSLLTTLIYYILLGRKTNAYSTMKAWFFGMLINAILVFIVSLTFIGYNVFQYTDSPLEFDGEIWVFALTNFVYSAIIYAFWSIILNNGSIHSKFIPFNIIKKN